MNKIFLFITVLTLIITQSCSKSNRELVILKVSEIGPAKISDSSLAEVLEEVLNRKIRLEYTLSEDTALKKLENKEVDFAIIPNNTEGCKKAGNLRTVTPLLPRILVILANNIPEAGNESVKTLFEKNHVIFEEMSRLDSLFFETFFDSYGISPNKADSYFAHQVSKAIWGDSSFVYVGLTHLHNKIMFTLVDHGAKFFSLDNVSNLGKGSSVEGLKLDFPKLTPFILPKSFHNGKPEKAVLTIAIPDVMVTCAETDKYLVYDILKAITEKKAELLQKDNIYNLLDNDKKDIVLSFPLHQGAIDYINRNKPSVWSRYASLIWPFLSILAILAGALASARRQINQRKKVRIDLIYTDLLHIRKRAIEINDEKSANLLLKEMRDIRSKAFDALMNNKLDANESFSIFLSLYSEVEHEINKMAKKD